MKQLVLWGVCDCVFMAAFVAASMFGLLAIGI